MRTGFVGTFVISWSQTSVDGLEAAPVGALRVGAVWSWRGNAVQVDGPGGILRLDQADGEAGLRKRAARSVRRLVGAALDNRTDIDAVEVDAPLMENSFVVTDGLRSYTVTVIEVRTGVPPLLMFLDQMPPGETDLWVVHRAATAFGQGGRAADVGGVICFAEGTWISTPDGSRPVETLGEGDRVLTRDGGPQEIVWTGRRRMSGARLFAMPKLRPIRIGPGALGIERPEQELLVSPDHRMLLRGPEARALFNTPEVLVPAAELVNGGTVRVDVALREVTYVHLMLPAHHVIWANGVEAESFHPAGAGLNGLGDADRARLLSQYPDLEADPHLYGDYARRNLSTSESAILLHEAA